MKPSPNRGKWLIVLAAELLLAGTAVLFPAVFAGDVLPALLRILEIVAKMS